MSHIDIFGMSFAEHQTGLLEAASSSVQTLDVDILKQALKFVFIRTPCLEVIARLPQDDETAIAKLIDLGISQTMIVPDGWATPEGDKVPAAIFNITIQDWLKRDSTMAERGSWLQRRWQENQVEDTQALGLAYEMMLYGQSQKAAIFLKRWLALAGKTTDVEWISDKPARLRVGETFLVVRGEKNFIIF